jgi:hypothetical protein
VVIVAQRAFVRIASRSRDDGAGNHRGVSESRRRQTRTYVEVETMAKAPIPTPEILWREPPVLALAALPGAALGRLGELATAWAGVRLVRHRWSSFQ